MKLMLLITLLLFGISSQAKTEEWVIDADHSKLGFSVSHLVISTVEGTFKGVSGSLFFDPESIKEITKFKVDVLIDAKSIDTGNSKRDDHLRSKDFFDAEKDSKITFKSSKFTSSDGKNFKILGILTIGKKSKEVELITKFVGSVSAYDVQRVAFKASTKVLREDFGLTWNDIVEAGPVIGSEVEISIILQAKKKADLE